MGDLIDITDKLKEEQGPWLVLQDPYSRSVHVVHMDVIEGIFMGEYDISVQDRQCVARAIMYNWYNDWHNKNTEDH